MELTFPEYRERHIFTSKLRIAIFVGFWFFYLYFLRDVLDQTKVITAIICISSFITGVAYYNIVIRNRFLLASFAVELLADLVTITSVIYLTGGPYSSYYTVYVFYCFATGVFYNHYLAAFTSVFSLIFYGGFLLLCNWGVIPPLILNYGDRLPVPAYTPISHFFFTLAFLGLIIYGVKIASYFSQRRERMLEIRNRELLELHGQLEMINEQLKEANRVKSEFLATMSHELRTPLTAIIGFSELMMEGVMGELSNDQKEGIQEVLNNGADLLALINSLLDLAKIEAGKMRLDLQEFDISETVERVGKMLSSLIQRKRHNLSIAIGKDLPAIRGDERRIQQILLNLLSNAIKFTPDGGKIEISVDFYGSEALAGQPWHSRIEGGMDQFSSGVFKLMVRDNGVGIQKENLNMVFDVFQQADSSITRSFGGTGLGLALAKQYAELHKGVIWVESEYGKGASFYLLLPKATNFIF